MRGNSCEHHITLDKETWLITTKHCPQLVNSELLKRNILQFEGPSQNIQHYQWLLQLWSIPTQINYFRSGGRTAVVRYLGSGGRTAVVRYLGCGGRTAVVWYLGCGGRTAVVWYLGCGGRTAVVCMLWTKTMTSTLPEITDQLLKLDRVHKLQNEKVGGIMQSMGGVTQWMGRDIQKLKGLTQRVR